MSKILCNRNRSVWLSAKSFFNIFYCHSELVSESHSLNHIMCSKIKKKDIASIPNAS